MIEDSKLPDDPNIATKVIDARARESGLLGKLFGTREHAPTNIAALALLLLFAALILLLALPYREGSDKVGYITALISAITFIVGLLFGRKVE